VVPLDLYDGLVLETQGSELHVLRGAAPILHRFRFIYSEVADFEAYVGCAQLSEMTQFLESFGFRRTACFVRARHPDGGRYYDVLYERRAASTRRLR
jgi:hypothetical protein